MVRNTYVSFEVAKLLKRLGFNEECWAKYTVEADGSVRLWECFQPVDYDVEWDDDVFIAPQVWLAVDWVWRYYGIVVEESWTMQDLEENLKKIL